MSKTLALVLAAGQILADIPEGFAVSADLGTSEVSFGKRLFVLASFVTYSLMAGVVSFLFLRQATEGVKSFILMVAAGLLLPAAIEDMLQEAHESQEDTSHSVLAFAGGFALFIVASTLLKDTL